MDEPVIRLRGVRKDYSLESRPWRRLWQQLAGRLPQGAVHRALAPLDLDIRRGESVGIIGCNGAGKSTLLQLLCGVVAPTAGSRQVQGRIAALLELGAGFNPELTGRENVRLNAPLLGLSSAEIEQRLPGIVEFADIGDFVDQPVRSYSSGMFVRLAFSMATSVEPDILVIDEALSVGDGMFARKSFDRIMALKERGATLLFCSHSLFQVEQLCARALWLHEGRVMFDGPAHEAVVEYNAWTARAEASQGAVAGSERLATEAAALEEVVVEPPPLGEAFRSGTDDLCLRVRLRSDPRHPVPTLGIVFHTEDGRLISSAGSWLDGASLARDDDGRVQAVLEVPRLPLLKGRYTVSVYVLCERSINLLAAAQHAARFDVVQLGPQMGIVELPHRWRTGGH
ncbi:MAG TPA: ABC transporter ATP-binding protein [Rubrivivax sp.]|jgi:lipopolysaccharide transport system ATP-binding protein|nr:ABC transporter ATP-binding protein [Rubrivivax sp.]